MLSLWRSLDSAVLTACNREKQFHIEKLNLMES
jgi:hypothetical protein